ncbi:Eukaryotic translation initiation factor 3 subunit E-B [Amphibalanus amphitrite]|uniref:Eukaryotic translation initiation factor 3 subunit E n=1 Tax=Amphibalanus amphitrite TaxID=1232801 RepID=A0A6A4VW89_AMPAM|nr:eukaryotic translation initiation factor 3 subunit E-B-like [Amphibalanus amphitrite]XP_043189112.1 eukaryotic translation initiation factor 3 subunit E-B-like [Amphibalanus amphitrite]XP_043189113.1 eukaryotic translation initiation factor 3 subunit E-B-like [Amphibalanus amphitrite]XP_043189114.1 eukaryotic translation initiation factor 3 subunit E-B-like [Amphibalanus amphitrite]XP_043189115.1 eukaryotic translation initiation factor 3 subunit E-B-like [Amphibalanus amphitrite]XP_0431932
MTEYDLSMTVASYLDRHMVFPLLEFLSRLEVYDETDINKCRLELLKGSNMVDYNIDILELVYPDREVPAEINDRRSEVIQEWNELNLETKPIFAILHDEEVKKQIQVSRDSKQLVDFLVERFNFKVEMMDTLYRLAKFNYEVGNYGRAAECLYLHKVLVPTNDKNYLNSLWGKFSSEILMQHWEAAVEDMNRLKEYIDNHPFSSDAQALTQRCWLIHWSLFVFFNAPKGYELLIDMFLYQPNYLNTIQTMCPHILRYLATAVVMSRQNRPNALKDLVKVIQQESYSYRDPITEFIECLYVNFDFDGAQHKLEACEAVLANDFFTVSCPADFIENARLMTFETFCRIHQVISINMLAQKLNMDPKEAERWIVNLIRQAHLDAKIDSAQGHVIMGQQAVSPYQQLIEKTKHISFRAQTLTDTIRKKLSAKNQEHGGWAGDM